MTDATTTAAADTAAATTTAAAATLTAGAAAVDPNAPAPMTTDAGDVNKPWYQDAIPTELHGIVATKGWTGPDQIAKSYVELEKLFGADKAGRTVVLPSDKATPEEHAEFVRKVGMAPPEKPTDYGIKIEGLAEEVLGDAQTWFHEAGIPKTMAEKLAATVAKAEAAKAEAWSQQSRAEDLELQSEWGNAYNDKVELFKRAALAAGIDAPTMSKMEMAIGTKRVMTMLATFGANMTEARAPAPSNNTSFTVTPAQAKVEIDKRMVDSDFQARYLSPNPAVRQKAVAEMEELHKAALGA